MQTIQTQGRGGGVAKPVVPITTTRSYRQGEPELRGKFVYAQLGRGRRREGPPHLVHITHLTELSIQNFQQLLLAGLWKAGPTDDYHINGGAIDSSLLSFSQGRIS